MLEGPPPSAMRLMFFRHLRFGLTAPMIDLSESRRRIMPTRTAKFMLMLFAISAPLCAADPYVGTWKMNVHKSSKSSGGCDQENRL